MAGADSELDESEGGEEEGAGEEDDDLDDRSETSDVGSDLRRATRAAKGFQSARMQEEQRLASVRVLAVLQNARALILNWSVMEVSADDAGFAKVQKSIQQLESLLLSLIHI